MKLLLKNAKIYDNSSAFHLQKKDILIIDGIISAIEDKIQDIEAQTIANENLCVSIGWIDMSVALRDPGFEAKEDIQSLIKTAANGGFTGILTMPNTKPTIQSKESIQYLKSHFQQSIIDIFPAAAVTKNCEGKDFTEMIDLHTAGAASFSDGEHPLENADIFLKTLQYIRQFDGLLIQKPEDKYLSMFGLMHEGITSTQLGMKGIPTLAEEMMLIRDLELLEYSLENESIPNHVLVHFNTISTARSVALIRAAKKKNLPVSCSIAAHQLSFLDKNLADFDTNLKVKPPFRTESDRKALKKGIEDGTIDVIVSDHQPHDEEAKKLEFDLADFGIIGLETAFAAIHSEGIELQKIIEAFTINPRRILKIENQSIRVGEKANLTLFNPEEETVFDVKKSFSKSKNSPFINHKLKGKIVGIINKNQVTINE
jgi:dihydroorotase